MMRSSVSKQTKSKGHENSLKEAAIHLLYRRCMPHVYVGEDPEYFVKCLFSVNFQCAMLFARDDCSGCHLRSGFCT